MRSIFLLIIFCLCFTNIGIAQDQPPPDSISLTNITTTDFMQQREGGSMNWRAVKPKCPRNVSGNGDCWSLIGWLWGGIKDILNFLFGGGGNDDGGGTGDVDEKEDEFHDDDDGGGGGGGGDDDGGWNPPPPPDDLGGGGGDVSSDGQIYPPVDVNDPDKPDRDVIYPAKDLKPPNEPTLQLDTIVRTDTLKPVVDSSCNDSSIKRGLVCDSIMKQIDTTAYMKKLRDSSSHRTKEAGFSIRTLGTDPPYNYKAEYYVDTGKGQSVELFKNDYTIAYVHLHPQKLDDGTTLVPSPSPRDCWPVIANAADTTRRRKFQASFTVYGGPNKEQFALVPSDTNAVKQYYYDTAHNETKLIDTAEFVGGKKNENYNNWVGKANDRKTLRGKFLFVRKILRESGYQEEYLETYATLIIMKEASLPVKLLQRDAHGHFKELNFSNIGTEKMPKFIIKICK